ncbi:hypothetical protein DKX38_012927 [Salix brachista]|uniref:Uncharacterized protein n=1 Tax=Salix brachista TaxID=2182728 RepID=A0A5N5LPS1_9ROSI|nr:hypothetical protein DKX38_012927 [Salix brachista]
MGAKKRWLFTLFSSAFLSLLFLLVYSISAFSSSKQFPSIVHHGTHYPPAFAYYISGGRGDKDQIFRLLLAVYHPRNRYLLHLSAEASDEERMRLAGAVNAVPAIRSFGNVDVIGKPSRLTYMGSSNLAAMLRAAAILLRMDAGWTWFVSLSATDYPLITQDVHNGLGASMNDAHIGHNVGRICVHQLCGLLSILDEVFGLHDTGCVHAGKVGTKNTLFSFFTSEDEGIQMLVQAKKTAYLFHRECRDFVATNTMCMPEDLSQLYKSTINLMRVRDFVAINLMFKYLAHVFSCVSRDLNFIDHTSDLGWKESQRIQPIIVDPGIYLARRSQIFHATEKRPTPDGFKVFTGKVYSL